MRLSYYKYNVANGLKRVRTKTALAFTALALAVSGAGGLSAALLGTAHASPTQVIVTPSNLQGWGPSDTRPGGAASIIADSSAPGTPNKGALQLTTNDTNAAKADFMHSTNTPLSGVTELSYSTKQNSASFNNGVPSYQLPVCLNGFNAAAVTPLNPTGCDGFTTLVYEPYNNGETITPNTWQSWDVMAGTLWSSRDYSNGACAVVHGAGGPPFYSVATLASACPNAVAVGFGVNIGSYNPSYDVEADLVGFNSTTYNFEPYATATDKDQCKDGGWMNLKDSNGNSFKNQGACVSFVASNGKSLH